MKTNYFPIRKSVSAILLAFTLSCISAAANATIFYISTTGNDVTGTGSKAAPWKTLFKASSTVALSGDIIHVNAGTYLETAQCILKPGVSIEGDDSTNTIIKTSVTNTYEEMINCRSAEGTNGNQHISNIKFDGTNTVWALIRIGGRNNFIIHDCSFVNAKIHGVTFAVHNTDDFDPGYPSAYATGNQFYNNSMYNCGNWDVSITTGFGALQFGGQKNFLIHHNSIIQNNTPYNNGWPIKYWQGGYNIGTKIYNNYLQCWLQTFTLGDQNWDFAIEMFNSTGMEISNNTMINGCVDFNNSSTTGFNTGGSFLVGGYGYSLWCHDNTFSCNSINTHIQTGITLEFSDDSVIIEKNTFDKFNIGVLFTPRPGSVISNVNIRNNLFTNVSIGEGSEGYFLDFAVYSGINTSFNKINVYNNTFIANSATPIINGIMLPNTTSGGNLKNFILKNNILKGTSGAPIRVREGSVAIDSLYIEYNSIYGCGNNNTPSYSIAPTNYKFVNNVNINPSFGVNYKLIAGTQLVDAGINVGLSYVGNAPDINWTDSTSAAPPVVCNSWSAANAGPGITIDSNALRTNKTTYPEATVRATPNTNNGKSCWYFIIDSLDYYSADTYIGIANASADLTMYPGSTNDGYTLDQSGILRHNGYFNGSYYAANTFKVNDTIMIALDLNGSGSLKFYKRVTGSWSLMSQQFTSITSGTWYPAIGSFNRAFKIRANFSPTDTIPGYPSICSRTSQSNTILPIKLLQFSVTQNNEKNLLQWQISAGSSSDHFNIERSTDGRNFISLGRIYATGYSPIDVSYSFIDTMPALGINYYRIKMIDKDNSFNYSNTVTVLNKKDQILIISSAQLSVGKKNATITIACSRNQKANLTLFDMSGRVFLNETIQLQKGINSMVKSIGLVSTGIYY
ncbi:MAG: hypothetical protein WCI49_10215, partial [Ferruginibacter sp.]